MESTELALPRMFAPEEPLVRRVSTELSHVGPTLTKARALTAVQVSTALDVAFWSSLGSNEGRPTRARILFAEPELLTEPIRFASPLAYAPSEVTRLAPATPEDGCIGVATADTGMRIWGLHPTDPGSSLHALGLWVPLPGVLHVRIGALRPFAVVSDGKAIILEDAALALPEQLRLRLGKSLVSDDIRKAQLAWRECLMLAALARRVLHRGHGGTLLVVPRAGGPWEASVEVAHRFAIPDTSLCDAVRGGLAREEGAVPTRGASPTHSMPEALRWQVTGPVSAQHLAEEAAALRHVAPYASVDGAVVMLRDLSIVGFGAKILVHAIATTHVVITGHESAPREEDVRPIEDTGGTRHQSAARFVGADHSAVAIVISHDGHVSLFFWDEDLESVRMMRNVDWWD